MKPRARGWLGLALCALVSSAWAQPVPSAMNRVDVLEQLGDRIPLNLTFTDSEGKPFRLDEAFHQDKPVILTLVYYRCMMLCNPMLGGMVNALRQTGLTLGKDYNVVSVSVDPTETPKLAQERKRGHLQSLGFHADDPAWRFLTTANNDDIHTLAKAVGFQYTYDAPTKQFAHEAVIFLLSPDGKLTRYLYGIEFPARDLKLSLVEASHGKVGTTLDRVMLTCFQYDPAKRRYGPYVFAFIRIGALLVFFSLAGLLTVLWRQELKVKKRRGAEA